MKERQVLINIADTVITIKDEDVWWVLMECITPDDSADIPYDSHYAEARLLDLLLGSAIQAVSLDRRVFELNLNERMVFNSSTPPVLNNLLQHEDLLHEAYVITSRSIMSTMIDYIRPLNTCVLIDRNALIGRVLINRR